MRKSSYIVFLLACLLVFGLSCKKKNNADPNAIQGMVQKNGTYTYDFGLIGIEDGMTVSSQPRHAKVSTLRRDTGTGHIIYTYQPVQDFTGSDEVEFTTSISNGGSVVATDKHAIEIRIVD